MNYATLFSGIGGPEIAADSLGWNCQFQCEINEFGRKILAYHFPNVIQYEDITKTDFTIWAGRIDCLIGGFPCQPFSTAGKRKGANDERHLWPEMLRVVAEVRPTWVIGENVAGITSMGFEPSVIKMESEAHLEGETLYRTMEQRSVVVQICEDLENLGYSVQPLIIPACAVNAPHQRARTFFIAHTNSTRSASPGKGKSTKRFGGGNHAKQGVGCKKAKRPFRHLGLARVITNNNNNRIQRRYRQGKAKRSANQEKRVKTPCKSDSWETFPTQPPVCGGDDGLSDRLDRITFSKWRKESLKAYGNAIVPQQILPILKAIHEHEKSN